MFLADITLLKPYLDHGMTHGAPTCDLPLWKLIDSSPATAADKTVVSTSRNLTIYFGQPYSVVKIGLITGQANEMPSDISKLLVISDIFSPSILCNHVDSFM